MSRSQGRTRAQIRSRVRSVLRDQLGAAVETLADDAEFTEVLDGGYDSLAALECISRIEEEFGIQVDFVAHDVRYWFATPGRIVQFAHGQMEDQAALGVAK